MTVRNGRGPAMTVLVAVCLLVSACGAEETAPGAERPPGTTATPVPTPAHAPSGGPAAPGTGDATGPSPSPTGDGSLVAGRYQPLWPFPDRAQADAWVRSYRSGGHQPWHLDADQTALSFTQGYLGFEGIDRVISSSIEGEHARVAVGFRGEEGGRTLTAAVLHLVRFGEGTDAPWEVVGTDDTTLSLTTPAYGAHVSSPVKVGGRVTGVDESIRVQARRLGSDRVLGESRPVQAGGTDQPWSTTVTLRDDPGRTGSGQVVTLVASTGGHLAEVERFAVTGVRVTPGG